MRFELGEIVVWAGAINNPDYNGALALGDEVEISVVGPLPLAGELPGPGVTGDRRYRSFRAKDYICRHSSGYYFTCNERSLRKRRPPIPDEVLRVFDTVSEPA